MSKPILSIVTVTYNDCENLAVTLSSLFSQTFSGFQYVVIDGFSDDSTPEIVAGYPELVDVYIREPDKGIYDAMNKSLNYVSGKYVLFLNSGDVFCSSNTVERLIPQLPLEAKTIIYGNHDVDYGSSMPRRLIQPPVGPRFSSGSFFCHQASLVPADCLKTYRFNTSYRLSADYDFFLRAWRDGTCFRYVNIDIASITPGGVSDVNQIRVLHEWIRSYYFHFSCVPFSLLLRLLSVLLKTPLKLVISRFHFSR